MCLSVVFGAADYLCRTVTGAITVYDCHVTAGVCFRPGRSVCGISVFQSAVRHGCPAWLSAVRAGYGVAQA